MAIPAAVIGGLISGGGAVAGSLLGKGKSQKAPDVTPLIEEKRRGTAKGRALLAEIAGRNQPIFNKFQRRMTELGTQGAEMRRKTAQTYLGDLGRGVEATGLKRANLLRQQILSAQPEQQQALLEAGAATGGVRRGATSRALQANVQQNQAALNQLTAALDIGSQEAVNTALGSVFQTEIGAQLRQQGVDEETARYLAETGRGDVIRELAGGAELEAGASNDIINIMQGNLENIAAARLANTQQRNKTLQGLIGGITTAVTPIAQSINDLFRKPGEEED